MARDSDRHCDLLAPYRLAWARRSALGQVLRRHPLVHVPAPRLEPDELIALASGLGTLEPERRIGFRLRGSPEIMVVGNVRDERGRGVGANAIGHGFHVDRSFQKHPPELTLLYALEAPVRGGDTEFASLHRLYDECDEATRAYWATLEVEHEARSGYFDGHPDRCCVHPLVRRHPDTGRRLVYASPPYMRRVIGLPTPEGDAILARIRAAMSRPDAVHRWRPNDLLIWDNRAVAHRATRYDPSERRRLWRIAIRVGGASGWARP